MAELDDDRAGGRRHGERKGSDGCRSENEFLHMSSSGVIGEAVTLPSWKFCQTRSLQTARVKTIAR
jgi:hypothetical protein